jgi:predicted nucleic acid-binding protein
MNRIVIDTNIVISFLTDRDPRQQEIAARMFQDAEAGQHELILHQIVVTEAVYVMRNLYRQTAGEVAATIRELIELPGIIVVDAMPWADLFDIWPQAVEAYADAALVAVTRHGKYDALATFDHDLLRRLKKLGTHPYPYSE